MAFLKKPRLGEFLLDKGLITQEQLKFALEKQKLSGQRLGNILVETDFVKEQVVINLLSNQLGIPQIHLYESNISQDIVKTIPEVQARKYTILAFKKEGNKLSVAMADPLNLYAIDELTAITKCEIDPYFALTQDIKKLQNDFYGTSQSNEDRTTPTNGDAVAVRAEEAPVITFVSELFKRAIKNRASDIHLEPMEKELRVRFRVDGALQPIPSPPLDIQQLVIPRIKLMANMNIAERRLPQDGRIEVAIDGQSVDLRVSSLPTIYGEKIVLRVLDKSKFLLNVEDLGFSETNRERYIRLVQNPFGMILVTGPTGCGKTSTLYTALNQLNSPEDNVITVEDPVEYRLPGINQVQINTKAGLTFASGLRSILRQDPNIVMVGEIRDSETADIAIRAALTGHLVLSTLHTNDAAGAITRFIDMGIEPFLVASSVAGVIAQRLVRKLCPKCKEPFDVPDDGEERNIFGTSPGTSLTLYKAVGCPYCNRTGYYGRTAIHEVLLVDQEIKALVNEKKSSDIIAQYAINNGMKPLKQDGLGKALEGTTTYQEVLKVAFNE